MVAEKEREETENAKGEPMYKVVVNHEEQYSLWPSFREIPDGWKQVGPTTGKRQDCLDWIKESWTDMRPKSLREAMEKDARERHSAS